jgi:uncharacterized protein YlbG (UPF0298 family)
MMDREFVTRFIAFYLYPYSDYIPDLDTYMNKAMSDIKKVDCSAREKIKSDFTKSMKLAKKNFNNWAFRKSDKYPDKRKPNK